MIIAIANQKGGVGKTTTAVTLGHGLARHGWRVLLADLDSQGNVADSLGLPPGGDLSCLLSPEQGQPLPEVVTPSGRENLDVLRSDKTTARLKLALAKEEQPEERLERALVGADYDLILLDCAPSMDLFHYAALLAADWLVVPTRLDKLAVNGVRDTLQTLASMRTISHCQLAGIIPTFFERVTRESFEQLQHLARLFGKQVLPPVPQDTLCREASRYGQTLWEYAPHSRAMRGYALDGTGKTVGGYAQVLSELEAIIK